MWALLYSLNYHKIHAIILFLPIFTYTYNSFCFMHFDLLLSTQRDGSTRVLLIFLAGDHSDLFCCMSFIFPQILDSLI